MTNPHRGTDEGPRDCGHAYAAHWRERAEAAEARVQELERELDEGLKHEGQKEAAQAEPPLRGIQPMSIDPRALLEAHRDRSPATRRRTKVDASVKIAVVGSREFPRLDAVRQFVWEQERTTVIVTGGASGVDEAALQEAIRLGMPHEVYLPDWQRYGRRAGAIRNQQIVDAAHEVVAFWDGKSRGTKITMDVAKSTGKRLRVFSLDSATLVDAVARADPPVKGENWNHGYATWESVMAKEEVGKPCSVCGEIVRLVDIDCKGAKERGEPMPQQEVCRCIHPGDLFCNCGKPCWNFF